MDFRDAFFLSVRYDKIIISKIIGKDLGGKLRYTA